VAALAAFRRGWDVLAGVVMALRSLAKVTPALFVAYSLKASLASVGGVGLGLALFFFVIPAAVLGWPPMPNC